MPLSGAKSNKETGLFNRVARGQEELRESVTFLAGFLLAMRATKTTRHKQFMNEGEDLMVRGNELWVHAFYSKSDLVGSPGLPRVKKMRKLHDEIVRFVNKAEVKLKAS
jgi:hypothetical protein